MFLQNLDVWAAVIYMFANSAKIKKCKNNIVNVPKLQKNSKQRKTEMYFDTCCFVYNATVYYKYCLDHVMLGHISFVGAHTEYSFEMHIQSQTLVRYQTNIQ